MADFVADRGETKRIFVDFEGLNSGDPFEPSTPPTVSISYPTMSGIIDADMYDDVTMAGRWLYDWDTSAVTDIDGKYRVTVEASQNSFKVTDTFVGYLFTEDVVDQLISLMGLTQDLINLDTEEDLRVAVAEQIYRALRKIKSLPDFTFDWNTPDHIDALLCRAEIYVLNKIQRMFLTGSLSTDFEIGDFRVRDSVGTSSKSPADILRTSIREAEDQCRTRWSKLVKPQYGRAVFVKYTSSEFPTSDPWNAHYQGPAQPA